MSKFASIAKVEELLSKTKKKVDSIAANKSQIFIFGAGNTSKLYEKCFETENINPAGFLDNDVRKQHKFFRLGERGMIYPPSGLHGRKDVLVLICSAQLAVQKAVSRQLEELGINFLRIDEYVFANRANELLKCLELLEDEESIETYAEIIECRLTGRLPVAKFIDREQYFSLPEFFIPNEKETFVDCGAFVGDSIEKYIFVHEGMFGGIIAFEPDSVNYRAMENRIERLNREWALPTNKIQLVNAGVGSKTTAGILKEHNGFGSIISEDTNAAGDSIKIFALDDFFDERKVDFLKADIESFELEMLKGAKKVIRRDLPKIAVCIYHNASDMYRILLWLDNLKLGYKFSVRHHSAIYFNTVLYAYR